MCFDTSASILNFFSFNVTHKYSRRFTAYAYETNLQAVDDLLLQLTHEAWSFRS
jgi:hypothetical protein